MWRDTYHELTVAELALVRARDALADACDSLRLAIKDFEEVGRANDAEATADCIEAINIVMANAR